MTYREAFPDFVLDVEIPAGFTDASWRNDSCPSWHNEDGTVQLYVDYADVALRECPLAHDRFSLFVDTADRHTWETGFDSMEHVRAFLAALPAGPQTLSSVIAARWVALLGMGYHPDTRGADYVKPDGSRALSDALATDYDQDMRLAAKHGDPYEAGIVAWRASGFIK